MKDLSQTIKSVRIEDRVSSKTNKPYCMLVVEFKNAYTIETFLNNDQLYILNGLVTGNH